MFPRAEDDRTSNNYSDYQEIETIVVLRKKKGYAIQCNSGSKCSRQNTVKCVIITTTLCIIILTVISIRPHSSHVFCIFILFCWSMRICSCTKYFRQDRVSGDLSSVAFRCLPMWTDSDRCWHARLNTLTTSVRWFLFICLLVTLNDYCGMNSVCQKYLY